MDPMDELIDMEEEYLFLRLLNGASQSTAASNPSAERAVILRNRLAGHDRLMKDYFTEYPIYNGRMFARRFRMSRNMFERICGDLQAHHQF